MMSVLPGITDIMDQEAEHLFGILPMLKRMLLQSADNRNMNYAVNGRRVQLCTWLCRPHYECDLADTEIE